MEDKRFEWVNRGWNLYLDYVTESLLTHITAFNETLGISLLCNDLIDYRENVYLKKIVLKNHYNIEREIRIFFTTITISSNPQQGTQLIMTLMKKQ